jgi:hypothetical protein
MAAVFPCARDAPAPSCAVGARRAPAGPPGGGGVVAALQALPGRCRFGRWPRGDGALRQHRPDDRCAPSRRPGAATPRPLPRPQARLDLGAGGGARLRRGAGVGGRQHRPAQPAGAGHDRGRLPGALVGSGGRDPGGGALRRGGAQPHRPAADAGGGGGRSAADLRGGEEHHLDGGRPGPVPGHRHRAGPKAPAGAGSPAAGGPGGADPLHQPCGCHPFRARGSGRPPLRGPPVWRCSPAAMPSPPRGCAGWAWRRCWIASPEGRSRQPGGGSP